MNSLTRSKEFEYTLNKMFVESIINPEFNILSEDKSKFSKICSKSTGFLKNSLEGIICGVLDDKMNLPVFGWTSLLLYPEFEGIRYLEVIKSPYKQNFLKEYMLKYSLPKLGIRLLSYYLTNPDGFNEFLKFFE